MKDGFVLIYVLYRIIKMANVIARINQVDMILPNPALMSSSSAVVSRAMTILRPVIMDEHVVIFINNIRQQDMRSELLKMFWLSKSSSVPLADDLLVVSERTYLTSISLLLSSPGIPHTDMLKMFDEVDRVFNESQEDHIRAEAADIMHRFFPTRGERMLDELRNVLNIEQLELHQDNEAVIRMIRQQVNQQRQVRQVRQVQQVQQVNLDPIIYKDSQNVHNSTINESVITAARALIEDMVATVTFDKRYKFHVFRDDTVKSITYRLANILKRFPEDVTVLGDNNTQELQPRMTYRISKNAKSTIEVLRFKPEDVDRYFEVFNLEDYIFPANVVREGELGKRLEEVFIATNRYLNNVFETRVEEELLFYLEICGIRDAELIWSERDQILKDLHKMIGKNQTEEIDEFLDEVFDDIFPTRNMSSFIRRIRTSYVRDVHLLELLNAVWKFIYTKQGETFTEMKKRLKEEIIECMDVCTSGVCAHLVSVIQGYFDEGKQPLLKIKMSIVDELKAKLTRNIDILAIEREIDPVMDRDDFKKLIDEYIESNCKDILDEFTDNDIQMNGLSKQMLIDVAYKMYMLDD